MDSGQNDVHAVEALDGRRPVLGDPGHVDDVNLEPALDYAGRRTACAVSRSFRPCCERFGRFPGIAWSTRLFSGKGSWQQQLENVINQTGMEIKVSLPS